VPGPQVHYSLTVQWAIEEGMLQTDAEQVGRANVEVDAKWPGRRHWGRHFNPMALTFARGYMAEAVRLELHGDHDGALAALGRALHSRQDGIGHGSLGLAHLKYRLGVFRRNPDVWDRMPQQTRAGIEQATRTAVRDFLLDTRR